MPPCRDPLPPSLHDQIRTLNDNLRALQTRFEAVDAAAKKHEIANQQRHEYLLQLLSNIFPQIAALPPPPISPLAQAILVVNNSVYYDSSNFLEVTIAVLVNDSEILKEKEKVDKFMGLDEEESGKSNSSSNFLVSKVTLNDESSNFVNSSSPPSTNWIMQKYALPDCVSFEVYEEVAKSYLDKNELEKQGSYLPEIEMMKGIFYSDDDVKQKEGKNELVTRIKWGGAVLRKGPHKMKGQDFNKTNGPDSVSWITNSDIAAEEMQKKEFHIQGIQSMAESTHSKDFHDTLKRQEALLLEERSMRQNSEHHFHSKLETMATLQIDLQQFVSTMQTQLHSLAEQMHSYNKSKSVLGEGLAMPPEKGSSSTNPFPIAPDHTPSPHHLSPFPRVEFPPFDGDNPRAWIRRTQRYFQVITNIPEEQKVTLASIHLEGKAEMWFPSYMEGKDTITWSQFLLALLERASTLHKPALPPKPPYKPSPPFFNPPSKPPSQPSKPPPKPPRKLLTAAEMRTRREQSLCYNCDDEEEDVYCQDLSEPEDLIENLTSQDMTISINAISGSSDLNTLRIQGLFKHSPVQILIDSGNTHCFLDEDVAIKLGFSVEYTNPMLISVADGNKIVSRTICPDFSWDIQGSKFTYPMRLIKLGGCDVVLGGDWLRLHSPVEFDYHKMRLTICNNGKKLIIKAITDSAELQIILAKSMGKLFKKGSYGLLGQLFSVQVSDIPPPPIDPTLSAL
ncbi:hypothetical protein BUALT_Bualt09G0021800 [Buddleja alternifolia]|uniref:Uncharacterized protein n=1 Tax=Buddleja alternifolia TaxID=168488 RepID=A0AAV6XA59_9LAMI|nr:hypothetical protein BUALT_Bualt09G0021800 [Buddleja alternifolia]